MYYVYKYIYIYIHYLCIYIYICNMYIYIYIYLSIYLCLGMYSSWREIQSCPHCAGESAQKNSHQLLRERLDEASLVYSISIFNNWEDSEESTWNQPYLSKTSLPEISGWPIPLDLATPASSTQHWLGVPMNPTSSSNLPSQTAHARDVSVCVVQRAYQGAHRHKS